VERRAEPRLAPNWTTLAGAVEGVLAALGVPLPRHAVMGLTGCAFAFALAESEAGAASPAGLHAFDTWRLGERLARTGVRFERFAPNDADPHEAIAWIASRTERGVPVIAWALRLREWGIIREVDQASETFTVDDLLSPEVGPTAAWADWPWGGERIDLLAPVEAVAAEDAAEDLVIDSLRDAAALLEGRIRPAGLPTGAEALEAWARAFEEGRAIDRSGNAHCLAALLAARSDGATYFSELGEALPEASEPLQAAAEGLRREAAELAQLVTLFPYPAGGAGALASAGIRRIAAAALRRAADWERQAAQRVRVALAVFDSGHRLSSG